MSEKASGIQLLKHVTKRLEEFLHEHDLEQLTNSQQDIERAFSHWLRHKEKPNAIKRGDGMIAQEVFVEDVFDEHSATLAFVKIMEDGHVGVMWSPLIFSVETMMPDELREELIRLLRFHADKLEDRSLDLRMRYCAGEIMGRA